MTAIDATIPPVPAPVPPPRPDDDAPAASLPPDGEMLPPDGEMLRRVFEVLDRDGLAYCVTHAYEHFPQHIAHDVDAVVPREMLPRRLGELLKQNESVIDGRIVQWFEERANFIVLQGRQASPTGGPVMLQLHVSCDFEVKNRIVAAGNDILATRRSFLGRFCVPAPHVEFACVLGNRIDKGHLDAVHTRQLSALWAAAPVKCSEQLERMFRANSVALIGASALRNEWGPVIAALPALRREMMVKLIAAQPLSYLWRVADKNMRRIKRWTRRGGLHVVFLGPDGVGKSTVIEAVQQRLAPAFLRTNYQSFARGILGYRKKSSPHALPPRSLPASLVKAAWWLACYTLGYYASVYPTLVRGGMVVNHRYLLDAIVDPRRYRYSGPLNLLRAIWRVAPKPDIIIVLDAPADVIHARKRETTLEETTRQRDAYLALAAQTPNAHVVSTSQSPEQTIDAVTNILLDHMAAGVTRRLKLK
jgi:thymidylate kinase